MTETGSLRFVVGLNALAAGYDANGNMTLRLKDGARYFLAYNAESRLTSVSGTVSASFVYNGDGQRVTATIGTAAITTYIGGYFEWQGGVGKSYYFAGAQRIAIRTSTDLKFLLGDHLGSTSMTALASGAFDTETRYYPWGGVRWANGTTPTDYRFTGQQEVGYINLYWYGSRWYDQALGRFIQPDTIVPVASQGVQAWDRFSYVNNNPLRYTDPSGHSADAGGANTCDPMDLYRAYAALAERTSRKEYSGWLTEYYNTVAVYHLNQATGHQELIDISLAHVLDNKTRLMINGYGGVELAVSTAYDLTGAELAIGGAVGLSGVVAPVHHICTNKNWLRSPNWSVRFQKLFDMGGMTLEDAANKIPLLGHTNYPHSQDYHQWVYERLDRAIRGGTSQEEIRILIMNELSIIADELRVNPALLNMGR